MPVPASATAAASASAGGDEEDAEWQERWIRVKTVDGRKQGLNGHVVVERVAGELVEVRFVKASGDPLEWRRFFKKVVVLCRDVVLVPG